MSMTDKDNNEILKTNNERRKTESDHDVFDIYIYIYIITIIIFLVVYFHSL
jgi:hypothetical protein